MENITLRELKRYVDYALSRLQPEEDMDIEVSVQGQGFGRTPTVKVNDVEDGLDNVFLIHPKYESGMVSKIDILNQGFTVAVEGFRDDYLQFRNVENTVKIIRRPNNLKLHYKDREIHNGQMTKETFAAIITTINKL